MSIIPTNALVVVADGGGAKFLRNITSDSRVSLRNEAILTPQDLANDGPSGSRPEEQTYQQTNEATFAKQLAQKLYLMHHNGEFGALVLIADPQTLGQVRDAMHKTVARAIVCSVAKDLTNHSIEAIGEALREL